MKNQIIEAIRTKRVLSIYYEPGERLIEPHTLGHGSEGQILLRAYQVEGASASGEHEHWKLFRLDRLSRVTPSATSSLAPRTGYKRSDKAMKGGIIEEM